MFSLQGNGIGLGNCRIRQKNLVCLVQSKLLTSCLDLKAGEGRVLERI